METISYSAFRSQLARTLDKVNDDHQPILITRQKGKPAVVISLEDYHAEPGNHSMVRGSAWPSSPDNWRI